MPRPAAVSADTIRATVLAMLAEAGEEVGHAAPATGARFRKIVSVRKLRARLGAGDPALLSRHLNAIEAELVQSGLVRFALPELPQTIAEQMRALWQAAVAVQLVEVVQLKQDAIQRVETAETARHEAELRVELLRAELAGLREQLSARDTDLGTARAEFRTVSAHLADAETTVAALKAELDAARQRLAGDQQTHADAIATVHARYEGLSRQLLQETAHQRDA
jgi:chromosome segregation ATPase